MELAQRMDLSDAELIRLETGKNEWCIGTILSAARALGVRPFLLLMPPFERQRAQLTFAR